jgi:uncharacterized protein (DUF427 family)
LCRTPPRRGRRGIGHEGESPITLHGSDETNPSTTEAKWGLEMAKAIWNGEVIADSDDTIVIEGNHYFPLASVNREFLAESDRHTSCPWKGQASFYTIEVDGEQNRNAAWAYPTPKPAAAKIAGRIAFFKGVKVVDDGSDVNESGMLHRLAGLLTR